MVTEMVYLGLWTGLSEQESLEVGFEFRQNEESLQTSKQWFPDRWRDET